MSFAIAAPGRADCCAVPGAALPRQQLHPHILSTPVVQLKMFSLGLPGQKARAPCWLVAPVMLLNSVEFLEVVDLKHAPTQVLSWHHCNACGVDSSKQYRTCKKTSPAVGMPSFMVQPGEQDKIP